MLAAHLLGSKFCIYAKILLHMKHIYLLSTLALLLIGTFQLRATTLDIISEGTSPYTIIYAHGDATAKSNATELTTAINNLTGVELPIATDTTAVSEYEIVLGPTNQHFVGLTSDDDTGNAYGYVIRLENKKLIITGTDANHMVMALWEFEKMVLKDASLVGEGKLQVTDAQTLVATFPQTQATLSNIVRNGWSHSLSQTKVCHQPTDGAMKVSQGVCTDGTHVYFVIRNTTDTQARVYKYRMSDWSFVSKTEIFNGGHCNDLMYDAPHKRIICIRGGTNGDIKEQSVAIDPETMAVTEGPTIPEGATAIDYNATRNQYITRYGSTINVRDTTLTVVKTGSRTDGVNMTAQGMGTDADYFYFPMSPKSGETYNALLVYDWDNLHCKAILRIPVTIESESMFEHKGEYYVSYYQGGDGATLYRVDVTLKYSSTWTIQSSTLTLDANEGENTMEYDTYTQKVNTPLTISLPTRENYAFTNWTNTNKYIINYQGFECSSPDSVTFNGKKFVSLRRTYMYPDAITVNIWAYMDNWADYANGMRLISCTESGGFNIEVGASEYVQFACYDFGVGYKNARAETKWADITSGWHMFTLTFDGKNVRGYIDGQLAATSKKYVSGKIGYHSKNYLLLGAEAKDASRPNSSAPYYFKGMMKNVGIVPYALPAEEVAFLYAHPGIARYYFPDKDVTMHAVWKELPVEDALEDVSATDVVFRLSPTELNIIGVVASTISLFTSAGQEVSVVKNTNTLPIANLQGTYIAQVSDAQGQVYTYKFTR